MESFFYLPLCRSYCICDFVCPVSFHILAVGPKYCQPTVLRTRNLIPHVKWFIQNLFALNDEVPLVFHSSVFFPKFTCSLLPMLTIVAFILRTIFACQTKYDIIIAPDINVFCYSSETIWICYKIQKKLFVARYAVNWEIFMSHIFSKKI